MENAIRKSKLVQNFEAKPNQFNPAALLYGRRRGIVGAIDISAGDGDGSLYVLAPVRSSWVIPSIVIYSEGPTASNARYSLGLFGSDLEEIRSTAYDFGLMLPMHNTVGHESAFGTRSLKCMGQRVWEDARKPSDPMSWFYLSLRSSGEAVSPHTVTFDITILVD